MGEVVSQRTLGPRAGRRRPIPPHRGWRGCDMCDVSIIVSGVERVGARHLVGGTIFRGSFESISTVKKMIRIK